MASLWLYILLIPLGIIIGGVIVLILHSLFGILGDSLIFKRGIPKDRKKVSEWIKNNPKKFDFTNPGKPLDSDIKEVKEDERRRFEKYREFEKLRRTEINRRTGESKGGELYTPTITEPPRKSSIQNESTPRIPRSEQEFTRDRPRVKLDE